MKNIKKFISAALCAAMVLSAACSTTDETERKRHDDDDRKSTEASKIEDGSSGGSGDSGGIDISGDLVITPIPGTDFTASEDFDPDFTFVTTDREGNVWDESVFASAKLTMVNFWEPWCGPCIGEMPDLERLYEDYRDQGFQIIGVYSETGMESDVDTILKDCGTSYPILKYTAEFSVFDSGYVPTTIFVDGQGHLITMRNGDQSVIGSKSYAEWESLIRSLM